MEEKQTNLKMPREFWLEWDRVTAYLRNKIKWVKQGGRDICQERHEQKQLK